VVPQVRARLRVETGRGLVEEHELRDVHETERDVKAPTLPAREGRALAVPQSVELELIEQLLTARCG